MLENLVSARVWSMLRLQRQDASTTRSTRTGTLHLTISAGCEGQPCATRT